MADITDPLELLLVGNNGFGTGGEGGYQGTPGNHDGGGKQGGNPDVFAALDVGLGAISGIASAWGARSVARAQADIERSNNRIASGNMVLARTIQDVNNRRILEAGASRWDAAGRQMVYANALATRQGFEGSIQAAEMQGRASMNAAAGGLGGSLILASQSLVGMAVSRQEEYRKTDRANRTYEQEQAMQTIMGDAVRSMDNSRTMANHSYNYMSQPPPSLMGGLLSGLLGKQDSLHTFLGSLYTQPRNSVGMGQDVPEGLPIHPVVTSPVPNSGVYGRDLPALPINIT